MTVQLKVYPDERPTTRGECGDMPRPCPFLSCRYHLAHEWVAPHFGDTMSDEDAAESIASAGESCTLDVADRGGTTNLSVAEHTRKTPQAVSSIMRRLEDRDMSSHPEFADVSESLSAIRHRPDFDMHAPGDLSPKSILVRDKNSR